MKADAADSTDHAVMKNRRPVGGGGSLMQKTVSESPRWSLRSWSADGPLNLLTVRHQLHNAIHRACSLVGELATGFGQHFLRLRDVIAALLRQFTITRFRSLSQNRLTELQLYKSAEQRSCR